MTSKEQLIPLFFITLLGALFLSGCGYQDAIDAAILEATTDDPVKLNKPMSQQEKSAYYDTFYEAVTRMHKMETGTNPYIALDDLPKAPDGEVNWTVAVLQGFIDPKGSLDPNVPEEEPLSLTTFMEAKVPLMSNVYFPHSIHTYWLGCDACHPKIFIPKQGANPITMDEIFQGEWCGRCHGKVAFNFYPMTNCRRCHAVMKGRSLQKEHWK